MYKRHFFARIMECWNIVPNAFMQKNIVFDLIFVVCDLLFQV